MVGVDPIATKELTSLQLMREGDSGPTKLPPTLGIAPTSTVFRDYVWGRDVKDIPNYHKPRMVYDPDTCTYKPSYSFYTHHFIPNPENGGNDGTKVPQQDFYRVWNKVLQGDIIQTETEQQDSDHVYAIITIPGRITSTIDSRMQDGPYQLHQGYLFKHYMTMDTVKGPVPGFEKPTRPKRKPSNLLGSECKNFKIDALVGAFTAYRTAMGGLSVASPEAQIHFANPSPIYPSVVALPLMSKERCYGPWVSSAVDGKAAIYSSIGGDIEFVKDEELAPWGFAGYQLMNEAGRLQAQFSNSLMLFSERGGFVFPDAPEGNTLAKSLLTGGPLVTSISVAVGSQGVKTTYKMDLYTARFGKLAKQRETLIAQVSRERKKMRDKRNELIRKGVGKAATGGRFGPVINKYKDVINTANWSNSVMNEFQMGQRDASWIVASVEQHEGHGYTKKDDGSNDRLTHGVETAYKVVNKKSHQIADVLKEAADVDHRNSMLANTFGAPQGQLYSPGSMDAYHASAPYAGYGEHRRQSMEHLYDQEDENIV